MASLYGSMKQFIGRFVGIPERTRIPTVGVRDWIGPRIANPKQRFFQFLLSLVPIIHWLPRYFDRKVFGSWALGDLFGGLTVGIVVVPQSMSYAQAATLPPQYGLYSGFICSVVYALFATSKDVVIGPVAVVALLTQNVLARVEDAYPGVWTKPEIASVFSLYCGALLLVVAFMRLGWIVEFISAPAISGFMTGSSLNIAVRQIPTFLGITGISTTVPIIDMLFDVFRNISRTRLDAAWGFSGLVSLYAIRWICERMSKKYPEKKRIFFLINVLRNAVVLFCLTMASWFYCRHNQFPNGQYPIKILKTVPAGLDHVKLPTTNRKLFFALAPNLSVAVIIVFVQHMAATKSFARMNGYKIEPDQELVALGVTNVAASTFGAYPATAFFSCSALKAKLGVFTPASGIVIGLVALLAVCDFTSAFYWIPSAGLASLIIHAVLDLITPPAELISLWRIAPLELVVWLAAVLYTIFSNIENGTYASIGLTLLLLLYRLSHPRGHFLGRATIYSGDLDLEKGEPREIWAPLDGNGILNPNIKVVPPAPGVLVYGLEESLLYPNCSKFNLEIVGYVKNHTRRCGDGPTPKACDFMWNELRFPSADDSDNQGNEKPDLRSIVFDLSRVPHLDSTAAQTLSDTQKEVEKWAGHPVEFHFATILSSWIRRTLVEKGFGFGSLSTLDRSHDVAVLVQKTEKGDLFINIDENPLRKESVLFIDGVQYTSGPVVSSDTPLFYADLHSAVEAAESDLCVKKRYPPSVSEATDHIDAEYILTPVFGLYHLARKGIDRIICWGSFFLQLYQQRNM